MKEFSRALWYLCLAMGCVFTHEGTGSTLRVVYHGDDGQPN